MKILDELVRLKHDTLKAFSSKDAEKHGLAAGLQYAAMDAALPILIRVARAAEAYRRAKEDYIWGESNRDERIRKHSETEEELEAALEQLRGLEKT